MHNNTANLNRVAENIPIVYLWAVAGALYVAGGIRIFLIRRGAVTVTAIFACCVLAFATAEAYDNYFRVYIQDPGLRGDFGFQPELTEPAEYIARLLKSNPDIQVWAEYINTDSFRFVLSGSRRLHEIDDEKLPQLPAGQAGRSSAAGPGREAH